MTAGNNEDQKWGLNLPGLPRQALELLVVARERDLERLNLRDKRDWSYTEHFTFSVVRMALEEIRTLLEARASGRGNVPEVSDAEAAIPAVMAHVTMERTIAEQVGELLKARGLKG